MGKTKKLVISAILLAWIIVLGVTQLGLIPVGPVRATTLHIPALIGSILFDLPMGIFLGLSFGLYSWYQNFRNPTILSFVFQNPVVSVLPRIIFPIIAYYLYRYLKKKSYKQLKVFTGIVFAIIAGTLAASIYEAYVGKSYAGLVIGILLFALIIYMWVYSTRHESEMTAGFISASIATMCHTIMVMGLIYLIYLPKYMEVMNLSKTAAIQGILATVFINGVPEAVIAGFIVSALLRRKGRYDINN